MKIRKRYAVSIGAAALGLIAIPTTASIASATSSAAPTSQHDIPAAPALTDQQRQAIVSRFAAAIVADNHAGIVANTTSGIVWTIPGDSKVSGRWSGHAGVIRLADTFAQYNLHISVQALTYGEDTVAVEIHDTGTHNGKTLDLDTVNVLTFADGKVAGVNGNVSSVSENDTYFS